MPAMAVRGDGRLGSALVAAGDVDGDGLEDLLAGTPTKDDVGRAFLIRGDDSGQINNSVSDGYNARYEPADNAVKFGNTLAAGDLDNDGDRDVFIADPDRDDVAGQVYQLVAPGASNVVAASATPTLTGAPDSQIGNALAVIDSINGDAYPELLVGARGESVAYIFFGGPDFALPTSVSSADVEITGVSNTDFGQAVSGAGDINGDGTPDFMISQTSADGGSIFIFFGWGDAPPSDAITAANEADIELEAEDSGHRAGTSIAAAGDVDGDGIMDIVVGATGLDDTGDQAGGAYLVLGSELRARGDALSLADAVKFTSPEQGAFAGQAVSGIGDFDDDGFDDFAVGASFAGNSNGAVYVIFGPVLGPE
jgi:hypothetical protein